LSGDGHPGGRTVESKGLKGGALGLMIAFYYGLTGFACAWFYRKTFTRTTRDFVVRGVIPLLGGLVLLVMFMSTASRILVGTAAPVIVIPRARLTAARFSRAC
jgi:hypothetical protein